MIIVTFNDISVIIDAQAVHKCNILNQVRFLCPVHQTLIGWDIFDFSFATTTEFDRKEILNILYEDLKSFLVNCSMIHLIHDVVSLSFAYASLALFVRLFGIYSTYDLYCKMVIMFWIIKWKFDTEILPPVNYVDIHFINIEAPKVDGHIKNSKIHGY